MGPVAFVQDTHGRLRAFDVAADAALCAKADLLADVLFIQLGLLVVLFGRRFKAGWRSHAQQIASVSPRRRIAQLAVRSIWQRSRTHTTIHSAGENTARNGVQEKF